ncbi:MAG: GNAT family N-acetyltransferase [Rhodocyclales bacterium]|nr:GNAT family N-acetyltransferase [Rhodocyclales bacterium]
MQIPGQRIFLRPLEEKDVGDDYLGWMRDPQVIQYLESRDQTQTLETLREFVRAMNASTRDHLFGIFLAHGGEHIGNIKIGSIREPHRSADLGLIIGRRSVWGKGYATEAIALATRYALEQLELNKLWAGMYAENLGSYHAFIKAGYREVGRFHRHILFNGRYIDSILVEKCRNETAPA